MLSEEEKKDIEYAKSLVALFDKGIPLKYLEEENDMVKKLLNLITKLQKENEEVKIKNKYLKLENGAYGNTIVKQDIEIEQKDRYIKNSEDITKEMNNDINKLLLEIKEKDNKVRQIINRLDNDIFRISKSKEINKWDDYRRCRLKAYRTKTREIKEYIEQEYFKKTLKENK